MLVTFSCQEVQVFISGWQSLTCFRMRIWHLVSSDMITVAALFFYQVETFYVLSNETCY